MNRGEPRDVRDDGTAGAHPDEVTSDVDPAWLEQIIRESRTVGTGPTGDGMGRDANVDVDRVDADREDVAWDAARLQWADDMRTVANEDVLDQIREAVRAAQGSPSEPDPPTSSPAPFTVATPARPVPTTALASAAEDPSTTAGVTELQFPPPDPLAPIHTVKAAPIPVRPERWQPTQALKPATTLSSPALLVEETRRKRRLDRTVVMIIAAAIVVGLAIGFVLSRTTDDAPAPTDDTTVTTDSTPAGATPTTSADTSVTTPTTGNTAPGS